MNELTLIGLAKTALMEAPYSNPNFPPSPYYRFLRLLAVEIGKEINNEVNNGYKARLSVELGVCGGGGSLHMAMGSAKAIGIDITNDYPDNIKHIQQYHPNFEFIIGDSVDMASIIYNRFGAIDLLFIDTTHTYKQTMTEYNAYKPYLSDRAIICLDDLFRPEMGDAPIIKGIKQNCVWDKMPAPKKRFDFLHPSQAPTDGGFGVIWKE